MAHLLCLNFVQKFEVERKYKMELNNYTSNHIKFTTLIIVRWESE